MKKIGNKFGAALVLLVGSFAHAGVVTVPNTFSAGTPAKAAEVNGNFSALQSAVNDSAATIGTLNDRVTTLESAAPAPAAPSYKLRKRSSQQLLAYVFEPTSNAQVTAITPQGYQFFLGNPAWSQALFTGASCTGTAIYAPYWLSSMVVAGVRAVFSESVGWVVTPNLYAPIGATPINTGLSGLSKMGIDSVCISEAWTITEPYVQLVPNDPVVTGIPTSYQESEYVVRFN